MAVTIDREAFSRCRDLVFAYHHAIDSGRATVGVDAFAEHAEFEAHGRVFRGRDEIEAFLRQREANVERHTIHVVANDSVAIHGEIVEMHAVVLLYVRRSDGSYGLDRVLDSDHTFEQVGDDWRIIRRTSRPLHPDPAA